MLHGEQFSGPLPPPDILRKYDEILVGAAERILVMAENQSKHRQKMESKVIGSDVWNSKLGLTFGFLLGLVGLLGSFYCILNDKVLPGGLLGAGTIVTLAGAFIYGSHQRKSERAQRSS